MDAITTVKPWERLRELLAEPDSSVLVEYLKTLSSDETVREDADLPALAMSEKTDEDALKH